MRVRILLLFSNAFIKFSIDDEHVAFVCPHHLKMTKSFEKSKFSYRTNEFSHQTNKTNGADQTNKQTNEKSNKQIKQIASAEPNEPIESRLPDRANAPNETEKFKRKQSNARK